MSIKNLLTFAAPRRFAVSDGCTFLLKLSETLINSSIKNSCHTHSGAMVILWRERGGDDTNAGGGLGDSWPCAPKSRETGPC